MIGVLALSAAGLASCSFDSHAAVLKDAMAEMTQMYYSLNKITRPDALAQYKSEIDSSLRNLQYIKGRKDALGPLSPDEREHLRMKYGQPLNAVYGKVSSELNRVGSFEGGGQYREINKFIKESFIDDFRPKD
jgi:hypothetical protein